MQGKVGVEGGRQDKELCERRPVNWQNKHVPAGVKRESTRAGNSSAGCACSAGARKVGGIVLTECIRDQNACLVATKGSLRVASLTDTAKTRQSGRLSGVDGCGGGERRAAMRCCWRWRRRR